MSEANIWIVIGLLMLATIITRGSLFLLGHAVKLPPKLMHALRYAPAAALAAIVAPDLLLQGGALNLSWTNPKLMAGIVAAVFFLGTRHLLGTLVVGMAAFSLLRIFG